MSKLSSSLYIALIVSFGGFVFGFDASVISGVVSFVSVEFNLTDWQQGFVVSSPTLGAVIASSIAGTVSDKVGRKKVLLVIAFLYLASAIFSTLATSYEMLVTARFLGGMAFASLILAPVYIAEISPAKQRGRMISINQFNIVIGLSAAYFTNYYLINLMQSDAAWVVSLNLQENIWRWMLGLEILPALLFFVGLMFIPESPRYLVMKGREQEAKAILSRLHGVKLMEKELAQIEQTKQVKTPNLLASFKELFSKKMRLVMAIGVTVAVFQQITGVNAIYFYAPSIFEQSGVGTNAAFAQAVWVGLTNVVFTIIAMLLIDKVGRKPLLNIGLIGIALSMMLCFIGFNNATYKLNPDAIQTINIEQLKSIEDIEFDDDLEFKQAVIDVIGKREFKKHEAQLIQSSINIEPAFVLLGILGFVASFAVSLGPVMWVLLAEIFPNHLRGIAISFVGVINSAISFSIQLIFPWQLSNLGTAMTFLLYGLFAIAGFIVISWLLPETKGKTLEQIEQELAS